MFQKAAGSMAMDSLKSQVSSFANQSEGATRSTPSSGQDPSSKPGKPKDTSGIDWENFNYPPLLNLCHIDRDELSPAQDKAVGAAHWSFRLFNYLLVQNFIFTIILVSVGSSYSGINIFYSGLDMLIVISANLYSFYMCFKGVARPANEFLKRYLIIQIVMILVELLFSIIGAGPLHGWAAIPEKNDHGAGEGVSGFWVAAAVIESLMYTFAYIHSSYAWYLNFLYFKNGPKAMNVGSNDGYTPHGHNESHGQPSGPGATYIQRPGSSNV
eukprot:gnl/Hemi2/1321_TR465_c0_g1_i1.p1 gnl/Hemi2/1321_TR465_c0_g1~~gnl/Hemi2/1321_TR465_c0_g1_i1.p1  ORF type:complete len:270 (+),score=80.75 gnl/Hemi2/1321_TR465_c0_g1_i1:84-893(+)